MPWLEAMLRKRNVKFWYDRSQLGLGDRFKEEIEKQIDEADIALLLVSRGFMTSDFITTVELPRIEERAARGELVVMPIITRPCPWQQLNLLDSVIIMPSSTTPLIDYTDREVDFVNVREELIEGIERQASKLREKDERSRTIRGQLETAFYGDNIGDVDVEVAPLELSTHTDEHGRFEVKLPGGTQAEVPAEVEFAVSGYKPVTVATRFDEELVLTLAPEDWSECPDCGRENGGVATPDELRADGSFCIRPIHRGPVAGSYTRR